MKLATFNVNSIRARLGRLIEWLRRQSPDVVCLQETKVADELFPREPIEDEGYNVITYGQRTYNGVAILSRLPVEAVVRGFPEDGPDTERRLLGCNVGDLMVLNLYVPNGQAVGAPRFLYKLEWLRRLRRLLDDEYDAREKLVLTGDFNITFDDRDVFDPQGLRETLHCSTPERETLRYVMEFGLHDALRRHHEEPGIYTWWDYRAGALPRNQGLRIDHFLVSAAALAACTGVTVDREERAQRGASDHAPVIAEFD
jgi:exodeoxyribonuclease-3